MNLDHRKATRRVKVTDAQGKAIANAKLKFRQTKHKFLFGCGAFDFMPYLLSMNADEVPLNRPERFRLDPELLKKKID